MINHSLRPVHTDKLNAANSSPQIARCRPLKRKLFTRKCKQIGKDR